MKRIGIVVALAVALVATVVQTGSAQSAQRLSKQELHSLLQKAMSREDHQKLAGHYRSETERLEAEAKEHEEMAEMYKRNPHPLTQKHPMAVGEGHCRYVAKRLHDAAARTRMMAPMHEDMAHKATP